MFIFSILTSKGFTSLVLALEIFKAPNWKNIPTIKLINNCNIEVLVKYKKLGVIKYSSLLDRIIMGFKECSSLIIKTLIMCRIGED